MASCPCGARAFAAEWTPSDVASRSWMSPRGCWTRSILETATPGALFMINGGGSSRVWWTLWSRRSPLGPAARTMIKLPAVGGLSFAGAKCSRPRPPPLTSSSVVSPYGCCSPETPCTQTFRWMDPVGLPRAAVDHAGSDRRVPGSGRGRWRFRRRRCATASSDTGVRWFATPR